MDRRIYIFRYSGIALCIIGFCFFFFFFFVSLISAFPNIFRNESHGEADDDLKTKQVRPYYIILDL